MPTFTVPRYPKCLMQRMPTLRHVTQTARNLLSPYPVMAWAYGNQCIETTYTSGRLGRIGLFVNRSAPGHRRYSSYHCSGNGYNRSCDCEYTAKCSIG